MEGKRLYIFIGILGFILVSPIVAFNNASMGCYQRRIDKYPEEKSSKDWQLKLATIYYNTLRTEKAGECYEKFYTKWPEEPRRPKALEERAKIYEQGIREGNIVLGVEPRTDEDADYVESEWKTHRGEHIYR